MQQSYRNNPSVQQIAQQEIYQAVYNTVSRALQLPEYANLNAEQFANTVYADMLDNSNVTFSMVVDCLHAIRR